MCYGSRRAGSGPGDLGRAAAACAAERQSRQCVRERSGPGGPWHAAAARAAERRPRQCVQESWRPPLLEGEKDQRIQAPAWSSSALASVPRRGRLLALPVTREKNDAAVHRFVSLSLSLSRLILPSSCLAGHRSSWSRASSPSRSLSNSRTRDNKSSSLLRLQGPLDDIPIIQLPLDSILQYPSVLKNFNM